MFLGHLEIYFDVGLVHVFCLFFYWVIYLSDIALEEIFSYSGHECFVRCLDCRCVFPTP